MGDIAHREEWEVRNGGDAYRRKIGVGRNKELKLGSVAAHLRTTN